jgi:hypothetical protein
MHCLTNTVGTAVLCWILGTVTASAAPNAAGVPASRFNVVRAIACRQVQHCTHVEYSRYFCRTVERCEEDHDRPRNRRGWQ